MNIITPQKPNIERKTRIHERKKKHHMKIDRVEKGEKKKKNSSF